jgi:acyl-CoA hydrolase
MKSLNRLIALVVVLMGLTLATGVASAAQLDQRLAGMFHLAQGSSPEAQDFMDIGLRTNNAQQKSSSSSMNDDDEIEIIGTVTSITTDTLVVSDTVIAITPETEFEDEVAVGDMVKVEAFYADDGTLTARKVELFEEDDDDEFVTIIGTVTSITTDTLVVSDTVIAITPETEFEDEVAVGDMVKVKAFYADDGTLTALKVRLLEDDDDDEFFKIIGTVTSITTDTLVVSDTVIAITPDTIFEDEIAVGDMVKVKAFYADDGTLTAAKVALFDEDGNGHAKRVRVVGIVESYSTDSIVVSGIAISVTEQTKIQGTIDVGDLVRVHAFMADDNSLTAWKIKELQEEVDDPGNGAKMVIGGFVESLTSDMILVSGFGFAVSPDTEFVGDVGVGDYVKVQAYTAEDGTLTARRIILLRDGSKHGPDDSARGNDASNNQGNRNNPGSGSQNQGGGANNAGGSQSGGSNRGGSNAGGGGGHGGGNDKGGGNGHGGGHDR